MASLVLAQTKFPLGCPQVQVPPTRGPARFRCHSKPGPTRPSPPFHDHTCSGGSGSSSSSNPRGLNDPSLVSTWPHRACLASGCAAVGLSLARCLGAAASSQHWLGPGLAAALGYALADLGTGVYHWGIDNYGDPSIPFVGPQIERAQGHHTWPSTIARRQAANNLHAAAAGVAAAVFPIDLLCGDPAVHAFVGVFAGCVMFSQQFHAWAHSSRARVPPPVAALQDLGVLLSPARHAVHHRGSNGSGYCIVSGLWNDFLDDREVFKTAEMFLFARFGVRPINWGEPDRNDLTE